jgi:hypothetical protein
MAAADPTRRSQIAAHGADASWANTLDWSARTAAGRAARRRQFEDQVDPQRVLDPATRAKRADKAEKAAMRLMSRKGVLSRRRKVCVRLLGRPVLVVVDGVPVAAILAEVRADDTVALITDDGQRVAHLERVGKIRAA